jgi:hypothetical protein
MIRLCPATDTFHGRVIAARLAAEGIPAQLRGAVDGPYPCLGDVSVYVSEDDLHEAAEILLVDEVEAALSVVEDDTDDEPMVHTRLRGWLPLASVAVATCTIAVRGFVS